MTKESIGHVINRAGLPTNYPTHAHDPAFWGALGRTVATFGFLEEVLLRAIFALTVTTHHEESEIESAYAAWVPKMTRLLSDPLGSLIDTYGKAIREHSSARIEGLDDLMKELRSAQHRGNGVRSAFDFSFISSAVTKRNHRDFLPAFSQNVFFRIVRLIVF